MGNLEHNIKEAFAAQDAKTKLADKDGMWNRLDSQMGRRSGVAALWRVAAILLGVFLLTGAFAAFDFREKQLSTIEKMEMDNVSLVATIDSLRSLPVATKTEVQIVEKEKLIYRDRTIIQQNSNSEKDWEQSYNVLADSADLILASNKKQVQEIVRLGEELVEVKQELIQLEEALTKEMTNEKSAPFKLKSGHVEVGISKTPAVKNPDMKMKVFQKNFIENRNNLNKNIFKK